MCRLLGIVTSPQRTFDPCLRDLPRSMLHLSPEHPDGWGIAVQESRRGWRLRKQTTCAARDAMFATEAASASGSLLIAHVRQRTVGAVAPENTHPFHCGSWVFAHNGTLRKTDYVRRGVSPSRRVGVRGDTDSELLFAFLLSRLDAHGATEGAPALLVDAVISRAARDLARAEVGSFNFLLSDGRALYAHRRGRDLFVRKHDDERDHSVTIASEPPTAGAWTPLREGELIAAWRNPIGWDDIDRPRGGDDAQPA